MLRYPVPNVNGDVGLHGEILRKPAHIRPNPFRILTCNVQGVAPLQHHSGPRAIQSHTNAPIAAANIFAQVGKAHMQPATGLYGNLHRPFASCRAHPSRTPAISCGLESVVIPSMEASFRELSMSTERILSSSFSPPGRVVIVVPSAWSTGITYRGISVLFAWATAFVMMESATLHAIFATVFAVAGATTKQSNRPVCSFPTMNGVFESSSFSI